MEETFYRVLPLESVQCHSIIDPYPSSSTGRSYDKDKWTKLGNLPKGNALSTVGILWLETSFHFYANA
jgi:hypothetical protein